MKRQQRKRAACLLTVFLFLGSAALAGFIFLAPSIPTAAAGVTVPGDIAAGCYFPVSLTNSQASNVLEGTQVMLSINWEASYLSSCTGTSIQNVHFFDYSGNSLYAWCESNCGRTSSASTVWVKLNSTGIPAGQSRVIYLGFSSKATDNLGTTSFWGENPGNTSTYGADDNGAKVFTALYQNFGGSSCPSGWTCSSVTISNGLTMVSSTNNNIHTNTNYGGNSSQILDMVATSVNLVTSGYGWEFGYDGSGGGTNGVIFVSGSGKGSNPYPVYGRQLISGSGSIFTASSFAGGAGIYSIYYSGTASNALMSFSEAYGTAQTTSISAGGSAIGIGAYDRSGSGATISFSVFRLRTYPPNGVMPTVSLDTVPVTFKVTPYTTPSHITIDGSSTAVTATENWTPGSSHTAAGPSAACSASLLLDAGCNVFLHEWYNSTGSSLTTNSITIHPREVAVTYTAVYFVNSSFTQDHFFGNGYNSTDSATVTLASSTTQVDSEFTSDYKGTITTAFCPNAQVFTGTVPTYWCAIESDSGGLPSGHVLGAGSFTPSSSCTGTCSNDFWKVTLNATVTVTKGEILHFVIKYDTGTIGAGDSAGWLYATTPNVELQSYSDLKDLNAKVNFNTGSGWSVESGYDNLYGVSINGTAATQGQAVTEPIGRSGGAYGESESFLNPFGNYNVTRIGFLVMCSSSGACNGGRLDFRIYQCTGMTQVNICPSPVLKVNITVLSPTQSTALSSVAPVWFNESLGTTFDIINGTGYRMGFFPSNSTGLSNAANIELQSTNSQHVGSAWDWDGDGSAGGVRWACSATSTSPSCNFGYEDLVFFEHISGPLLPVTTVVLGLSVCLHESGATSGTFAVSGGSTNSSTITGAFSCTIADFAVTPSATITVTVPSDGGSTRYRMNSSATSATTQQIVAQSSGSKTVKIDSYFEQALTASYSVAGGGSPSAPALSGTATGASTTPTLSTSPTVYWLDYGTSYAISPNPLTGSSGTERWYSYYPLSGTVSVTTLAPVFRDQYLLTVGVTGAGEGSATPSSGFQNATATVAISATPQTGSTFTAWAGTGTGSYTGTTNPSAVTMSAAITESASFAIASGNVNYGSGCGIAGYPPCSSASTVSTSGAVTYATSSSSGTTKDTSPIPPVVLGVAIALALGVMLVGVMAKWTKSHY